MLETEKDKKIEELESEITMLKSIIYKMPGNVYWNDTDGIYLGCNENNAAMLRLNSPEEIKGKSTYDLLVKDLADSVREADLEIIRTKKDKRFIELVDTRYHVKPTFYLSHKLPLYNNKNDVIGVLGISFDISDRVEAEEKLKKAKKKADLANSAKSQFLAMISHELRTPLTSILGFVNFLKQEDLEAEKKTEYIRYIISSGTYLLSLINNLLDYSKLKNIRKINLTYSQVNLNELIEETLKMLSSSAQVKNLVLFLDYDANAPKRITTDIKILQQILINLLGNAIKFTKQGKVTVRVKLLSETNTSANLQIDIIDTGIGIPAKEQKAIFKQFYQTGNVYTRKLSQAGSGLGLAIVKKHVSMLKGKIHVESHLNKGSVFSFIAEFAKTDLAYKAPSVFMPVNDFKVNALLVEDDYLIQIVHKKMLEEIGCKVDIASSAKEALAKLTESYNILFIDIGLPDINGFELIRQIRQIKLYSRIPIVALTSYSEELERQQCLAAGANEVAIKPITTTELKETLSCYINKKD